MFVEKAKNKIKDDDDTIQCYVEKKIVIKLFEN